MRKHMIIRLRDEPGRQYYIAQQVTRREARVMNVDGPGLHMFSGYWYAGFVMRREWGWPGLNKMRTDWRHHDAFGKVIPVPKRSQYKVIAKSTRNSYLVRKLMR
jgi:hypothetical protein